MLTPNSSVNMQKHGCLGCFHAASTREIYLGFGALPLLTCPQRHFCGIHLTAISQEMLMNLNCYRCLEITLLKLPPHLSGDNKLNNGFENQSWAISCVSYRYKPRYQRPLRLSSMRPWSDTFTSDRCLNDIDTMTLCHLGSLSKGSIKNQDNLPCWKPLKTGSVM